MPSAVVFKLLAMLLVVALGWGVARLNLLGASRLGQSPGEGSAEATRLLSSVAFYVFIPALLFRASARLDLQIGRAHV